jgi:RNA polymerase sigma factor (sigma-70 family)
VTTTKPKTTRTRTKAKVDKYVPPTPTGKPLDRAPDAALEAELDRIEKAAAEPEVVSPALKKRVDAILAETYDFMDSEQFVRRGIEKELFDEHLNRLPLTDWYQPTRDEAFEDQDNVSSPQLMKPAEEKLMFLRFNFAKLKVNRIQRRIRKKGINNLEKKDGQELIRWHNRFEHLREYLVRTNLALVLAMAKRTRLGDVDFAEVVSEGNMALIRAVDKFNVDKGFKFSTYACRAILKAFSRTAMKHSRHRQRFPVEFEPDLEKSNWLETRRQDVREDCVVELKTIVDRNLADLTDVEQTVLKRRFNWEQDSNNPLTLEQVGKIIGVTKERVRQIQNKALTKIRKLMEEGVLRDEARERSLDPGDLQHRGLVFELKRMEAESRGERFDVFAEEPLTYNADEFELDPVPTVQPK